MRPTPRRVSRAFVNACLSLGKFGPYAPSYASLAGILTPAASALLPDEAPAAAEPGAEPRGSAEPELRGEDRSPLHPELPDGTPSPAAPPLDDQVAPRRSPSPGAHPALAGPRGYERELKGAERGLRSAVGRED